VQQNPLEKILPHLHEKNFREFVKNFPGTRNIEALDKSSRESMKRIFGTETDLKNILWLFRLKKYYKIEGDAAFSYLNPACHKISAEEISKLAHTKNLEEFSQKVASGPYGKVFESLLCFTRSEQNFSRAIRAQYKKEFRHENLAVVCGYLHALKLEQKNIRAITEGAKNNFSPEEIFSLLHV
jgi:V/A-type H+-transporting ATPase subunit C